MSQEQDHDHDDNMRPLQTATGAERLFVPAQPPWPILPDASVTVLQRLSARQ